MHRFVLVVLMTLPSAASAEMWCADPLWVHEWGVQIFDGSGAPVETLQLPAYFHTSVPGATAVAEPVRAMPVDSGIRALPVVQAYATGTWGESVPLAVEVGFREGAATVWYPQVDELRAPAVLPVDPRAQLLWERLDLTPEAQNPVANHKSSWVDSLRDAEGAMWFNRGGESERFLFYEGETREAPLLAVERGDTWSPDNAHYVLRNTSEFDVHDIFVVHRDGPVQMAFYTAKIPAGATAGFLLDTALSDEGLMSATRERFTTRLVDSTQPAPPKDYRWDRDACVMGRDPSVAVDTSEGHRLYQAEVDVLLDVWGKRFFEAKGTTIVYREDTAYLDAVMPLSLYTDMYHFVKLRRAGLVVWENLDLEALSAP